MKYKSILVFAVFAACLSSELVSAQPTKGPGNKKNTPAKGPGSNESKPPRPSKRSLGLTLKKKKATLRMENEGEGPQDKLLVELEGRQFYSELLFTYQFAPVVNNGTRVDGRTKTKFSLKILDIVEFIPQNVSKGFQIGIDEPISNYPASTGPKGPGLPQKDGGRQSWTWDDFQIITQNENQTSFSVQSSDGLLKLIAHATSAENGDLDPNGIKFDVHISNYTFTANNSSLALRTRFESDTKTRETKRGDENGDKNDSDGDENDDNNDNSTFIEPTLSQGEGGLTVDFEDNESEETVPVGKFTWVEHVNVDGVDVNVISSKKEAEEGDKRNKFVFFAFEKIGQFQSLKWDPELGVQYADPQTSETTDNSTDISTGNSTDTEAPTGNSTDTEAPAGNSTIAPTGAAISGGIPTFSCNFIIGSVLGLTLAAF